MIADIITERIDIELIWDGESGELKEEDFEIKAGTDLIVICELIATAEKELVLAGEYEDSYVVIGSINKRVSNVRLFDIEGTELRLSMEEKVELEEKIINMIYI